MCAPAVKFKLVRISSSRTHSIMSSVTRRAKWHPTPPPPPSPKILHFSRSRRSRRRSKQTKSNPLLLLNQKFLSPKVKGDLYSLFDQENHMQPHGLASPSINRRDGEEEEEEEAKGVGAFEEEKWRFQAEMLRAECNLLRMERELAFKKLDRDRVKMETTLRSAVHTLVSGKKKLAQGQNGNAVLDEEIQDLAHKLEKLQNSSRIKSSQVGGCSNFDKKASLLQHRLEKLGGLSHQNCVEELQQLDHISDSKHHNKSTDEAMEQESKCSGRCKAIVLRIVEQVRAETEQWSQMQRMLEQVRGEMQELQSSRDYWESRAHASESEMQSLRHAVEQWREKALGCEKKVDELQLKLSLAKGKMHKSKVDLRPDVNNVVLHLNRVVPLGAQLVKERHAFSSHVHKNNHRQFERDLFLEEMNIEENKKTTPKKHSAPLTLAKQLAKEKRSIIRSLKENRGADQDKGSSSRQELKEDRRSRRYSSINGAVSSNWNRSPLRDIGNSSPLATQSHRAAFVYHSPESSRIRESFRK